MKKWCMRAVYVLVAALILFVLFDLGLRWISSSAWLRNLASEKISAALGRDVKIGRMSASLLGIKADGVSLAEDGGFKNGEFAGADRIRLRFSWWHLFHKHVKLRSLAVSGVRVHAVKRADGSFNFSSLSSAAPAPQEETKDFALPVRVTLDFLSVKNVQISYEDAAEHLSAAVKNASLSAASVRLDSAFEIRLNASVEYQDDSLQAEVPVGLSAQAYLAELNPERAFVRINNLSVRYGDAALNLSANAENLVRPSGDLWVQVRRLSSESLKDFVPGLPVFLVPEMDLSASAKVDLDKSRADVTSFEFSLPGVLAKGAGTVSYAGPLKYDFHTDAEADLAELAAVAAELTEPYRPAGQMSLSADASNERLAAQVKLADAFVKLPYAGEIASLEASLDVEESGDFKTGRAVGKVAGRLNESPFLTDLRINQTPQLIAAVWNASAKRVALPSLPKAQDEPEPEFVADTDLTPAVKTPWPLPPVSVLADVKIDSLDAPYFYGTDVVFKADLAGLTPDLKNARGNLSLRTGNGEIRDLYHLTNASPVTKVLFLSLNVVAKVFNSLDVISVLGGLAGDDEKDPAAPVDQVVKTVEGPDGKPVQIMVPYTDRKLNGNMKYEQFDTAVHFHDGVAEMKEGTFVSDTVSFTLSGETNFRTEKIDMTVQAAPGRHYAGGIMPLRLNIGGTVAEPAGSMSVLGSVSSLVTQGVTNNVAARGVKKGIGGLFGLFKKKPKEPAEAAAPEAANDFSPQADPPDVISENETK